MARVYSQSQGKFIETGGGSTALGGTTPTGPIPGNNADTSGTSYTGDETALGVPKSSLQKLFFAAGLKNPKSITSLQGLLNLVSPSATEMTQKAKRAQAKLETNNGLAAMDDAWKLYKKMDFLELNAVPYSIAAKLPALGPNKAALSTLFFTNIEPAMRKQIVAGRATQQEIGWIRDAFFPRPTDTDATYKQRWNFARKRFVSIMADTTPAPDTTQPQSNLDTLYMQSEGE